MVFSRLLLLIIFFVWAAPERRGLEDEDSPDSIEHHEVILLAFQYRQQMCDSMEESRLGVFPSSDTATSLLSEPVRMHAHAAICLPIRQSDPYCSYTSMQC
jgi:hypothetical protein